jgi:Tetracyclin repressor-like, C-terminal domain
MILHRWGKDIARFYWFALPARFRRPDRDGGGVGDSSILAYLDFAATNTPRWRALFDHRLPPGREVPDWYRKEQQRLFDYVEEPLRELQTRMSPKRRALLARSLFSAVHGLVVLGLEEKLQAIPLPALREQMTFIVTTLGRGMATVE